MLYALDLHEALCPLSPQTPDGADVRSAPDRASHGGALAELSEVYRQWGFDSGYAQATRDHLELFVANAEAVLGDRTGTWAERDAARRLLYAFIARLERRMGHFARDYTPGKTHQNDQPLIERKHVELEGGLGI